MVKKQRIKMGSQYDSEAHSKLERWHVQEQASYYKGSKQNDVITERHKIFGQGYKIILKKIHKKQYKEEICQIRLGRIIIIRH